MVAMREALRTQFAESNRTYSRLSREKWLFSFPAQVLILTVQHCTRDQVSLAGTQIWWTTEVNQAFARLEEGFESAIKEYYKKQVGLVKPAGLVLYVNFCAAQVSQLNSLIALLIGDLTKGQRQMVRDLPTI